MPLPIRTQLVYWSIAGVVFFLLLWLLGGVLLPFLVGGAVAYFLDPVADRLERLGLSRAVATTLITFSALLAVVVLAVFLIPVLFDQLHALVNAAPSIAKQLQQFIITRFPELADRTSTLSQTTAELVTYLQSKGAAVAQAVLSQALGVIGWLVFIVVVPVVAFYLLLDWDQMVARIDALLPREHAPTVRKLAREVDAVLAAFVRGQLTVCLILGTYYAVGLMVVGLQFGLIVGAIAGAVTFIPYLGAIIGGGLGIGLALFQFWGDWMHVAAVVVVFVIGQFAEGNIITPKLVGKSVGVHPVWLIFALSAMGTLFGFAGLLIAVPTAAALGVLTRFAVTRYQESQLYRGSDDDEGGAGGQSGDGAAA